MSEVFKICAAALVLCIAAFLLREMGWRGAVAFSVFGAVALLSFLADGLFSFVKGVSAFTEKTGVSDMAKEVLKVVGASYVFGISADICTELGQRAVSAALVTVGRLEMLLISFPYFLKIIEAGAALVSG